MGTRFVPLDSCNIVFCCNRLLRAKQSLNTSTGNAIFITWIITRVAIVEQGWFPWGCVSWLFGTILKHGALCCIGKFSLDSESYHESGYQTAVGWFGKECVGYERSVDPDGWRAVDLLTHKSCLMKIQSNFVQSYSLPDLFLTSHYGISRHSENAPTNNPCRIKVLCVFSPHCGLAWPWSTATPTSTLLLYV